MRRFLLHVLPGGFHRIRHYGLLSNGSRRFGLATARQLLGEHVNATAASAAEDAAPDEPDAKPPTFVRRHSGRAMVIVPLITRETSIRAPPSGCREMIICTLNDIHHETEDGWTRARTRAAMPRGTQGVRFAAALGRLVSIDYRTPRKYKDEVLADCARWARRPTATG